MSIVSVRAISYEAMAEFLTDEESLGLCAALASHHDHVWIVSVTNSPGGQLGDDARADAAVVPLCRDGDDRIALAFDDVEPALDRSSGAELPRDPRYVYFDDAMARRVCAFVRDAHRRAAHRRDLLLVNCQAGVSRSGAIADFVRTVVGIDYDEFTRMNPHVVPNAFVRRTLIAQWLGLGLAIPLP